MSPRRRKEINRQIRVDNMRVRDGYYSWRHPETKVEYGLGRDRRKAISEGITANAHIVSQRITLLDRINGVPRSWSAWCDVFGKILDEREAKPNTRRTRKSQFERLKRSFPADKPAAKITTMDCSAVLDDIKDEGKNRTAQAFRSFLIDCFDRMIAKGWRPDNPARVLDEVSVKVKRARLTLEVFLKLYEATKITRLKNAMALALVSGQARESIAGAEFSQIHDGDWWNERGKTGARIRIPLTLRLDRFGMSLEDVVRQCRSTGVVSRYLVHETQGGKGRRIGKKIHLDVLTREFTWELEKLGLNWGGKEPPTFHEVRSLSIRLYKDQGNVDPQELAGHKDPRTTAIYTDGRGEWVKVGIK